jgi:hypothetical protein
MRNQPTQWLAVCANGAVALGSYEAGVLSQIYADVAEVNAKAGVTALGIDAIAGASAGSVTGALLAQALVMGEAPSGLTKRMRDVWVDGLQILKLFGDTDNDHNSAFDPACLDAIADQVLEGDVKIQNTVDGKESPRVCLWISLTNLDGIPFGIQMDIGTSLAYLYADYEPLIIQGGKVFRAPAIEDVGKPLDLKNAIGWDAVRHAAIASGAFPFAFVSRVIERDLTKYPETIKLSGVPTTAKFNYTDGGVLNNNPVGRAIDAASFQPDHSNEQRYYVVIDPDPTDIDAAVKAMIDAQSKFDCKGLPFIELVGKLVQTYFNDALYRDVATAMKTNERIDAYQKELKGMSEVERDAAERAMKSLGFGYKKRICLERIPAGQRSEKLAGAFQGHFGGFYSKAYREYDFALGCKEAREWMKAFCSRLDEPLDPPDSALQAPLGIPPDPGGYDGIPLKAKPVIEDKIANRAKALAGRQVHFGCSGAVIWVLGGVLRNALTKLFKG